MYVCTCVHRTDALAGQLHWLAGSCLGTRYLDSTESYALIVDDVIKYTQLANGLQVW